MAIMALLAPGPASSAGPVPDNNGADDGARAPVDHDAGGHPCLGAAAAPHLARGVGYVPAHGAGAGMTHPSLAATAEGLAARGIATLRFQFPFMEAGTGRPDPPARAQAAVRAAVAEVDGGCRGWRWPPAGAPSAVG
ncbi:MAG: alpha/beta family hydrolase [Dongiaceae bacterium]